MKRIVLLALLFAITAKAQERTGGWTEVVDSAEGKYSVSFEPDANKVDVTKLDDATAAPSAVKLRIHRKNKRPVDLKLRTLEVPNQPIRYEGDLRHWKEQSIVGFELDVSFDKKTWKGIKKIFGGH